MIPHPQCNLQGQWRNELGSNMTLSALDAAGTFSGSYHTAVAVTNKQIVVSPLQGAQQHTSGKGQPTFGFTVQWQFAGTGVPSTASQEARWALPMLGAGCTLPDPTSPPWHLDKPWLWTQISHMHSSCHGTWQGKVSLSGTGGRGVCLSVCLSERGDGSGLLPAQVTRPV